jgi:hypothetical protein
MLVFADANPPDLLDFRIVQGLLLLVAALSAWLAFDTKHSLERLIRLTERWNWIPRGSPWRVNPEKPGWIWSTELMRQLYWPGLSTFLFSATSFAKQVGLVVTEN